jgi:CubicO group peptidase (beta-lactamase class C family)
MTIEALEHELTDLAASDAFSGVIRIEVAGDVVFEAEYGLASRAWQIPCSPRTRFDTASITKLFTAVATLQQIDAGAFTLDTGVVEYLGLPAGFSPAITPYHLLTHTSGIADDADEEAGERYEDLFVERPNYGFTETAHALVNFVGKPPNFAPGEGCRYCNAGYVLLGLMIERATQLSYREYVEARVFAPAGMERSGFFKMDIVEPDVAEGADPITDDDGRVTGWHRNVYSYPPIGAPDGGAHVTAEDLIRFHTALLAGRLLGPDSTAAMLTPKERYRPRGDRVHHMGFGLEFETDAGGGVRCYWKEGINAGASGELCHYPASDLTAVVLSNMESGAWEPLRAIDRLVGPTG